jgi:hypothetical protein
MQPGARIWLFSTCEKSRNSLHNRELLRGATRYGDFFNNRAPGKIFFGMTAKGGRFLVCWWRPVGSTTRE